MTDHRRYPKIKDHALVARAVNDTVNLAHEFNKVPALAGDDGYEAASAMARRLILTLCWGDQRMAQGAWERVMYEYNLDVALYYAWYDVITDAEAENEDYDEAHV